MRWNDKPHIRKNLGGIGNRAWHATWRGYHALDVSPKAALQRLVEHMQQSKAGKLT